MRWTGNQRLTVSHSGEIFNGRYWPTQGYLAKYDDHDDDDDFVSSNNFHFLYHLLSF